MQLPAKRLMKKTAAVVVILHLIFFVLGVAPEHAAAFLPHDTCDICALIHHPPDLQPGATESVLVHLQKDTLPFVAAQPSVQDPYFETAASRAPPS
jgi:hypothetical protein